MNDLKCQAEESPCGKQGARKRLYRESRVHFRDDNFHQWAGKRLGMEGRMEMETGKPFKSAVAPK